MSGKETAANSAESSSTASKTGDDKTSKDKTSKDKTSKDKTSKDKKDAPAMTEIEKHRQLIKQKQKRMFEDISETEPGPICWKKRFEFLPSRSRLSERYVPENLGR